MSDSEDNCETDGTNTLFKPSFVLIAIDTDPLMFIKNEDGSSPFKNCINACYDLANALIFTQNKRSWSPFGIVLAREDASAPFVNFDDNVLNTIKFLKEKKNTSDDDLEQLYQRKGNLDLSGFFLFCKKKFKEVNSVFYKRIIIYITNNDNPVKDDKNQRFAALNEAKNFEANGITFEMVTMNPDFNYTLFYNELFSVMNVPLVETLIIDQEGLQEKLSSLILTRFYQRKLNFFPFLGDQSKFLRVRQKSFIREENVYSNAFMSKDGKVLKKIFKNDAEIIKKYTLEYDSKSLEFDMEEHVEIMNNNLPVGYTLLYVSDRVTEVGSVLIDNVILEVDPKEELPYFNSFWQYCADKNKVLICARKLKQLDKLRFVEFIPKFANNCRVFIIKAIPFNDENEYPASSLALDSETKTQTSPQKIKVVNELVNKLSFDYDPKMFTEPSGAKLRAFLKSKLLDEPKEDIEDVTLDNVGMDKCLGDIGETFKKLFYLEAEPAKKRANASASAQKSKKKK